MEKSAKFLKFSLIILVISSLLLSCHKKGNKSSEAKTPEQEISVTPENGFSATHDFPNNTFVPTKEFLPNNDILLHKEILLQGKVPDATSLYEVTIFVDYYNDVEIDYLPLVITAISPDSTSKRTQQYKVNFRENKNDKTLADENGRKLLRHSKVVFPSMAFSTEGKATFKVELNPPMAKFSFTGIKAITMKAEKVKNEEEA